MKDDIGDMVKAKHWLSEGNGGDCLHSCINSVTWNTDADIKQNLLITFTHISADEKEREIVCIADILVFNFFSKFEHHQMTLNKPANEIKVILTFSAFVKWWC